MFKSRLDKQKIQKINQDLVNGESLADVATKNSVSYQHACYFRKKLVKAGALNPLYKTTKRKSRNIKRTRTVNAVTYNTTNSKILTNTKDNTFTLFVNGTALYFKNAKSIYVSPEFVDVKY